MWLCSGCGQMAGVDDIWKRNSWCSSVLWAGIGCPHLAALRLPGSLLTMLRSTLSTSRRMFVAPLARSNSTAVAADASLDDLPFLRRMLVVMSEKYKDAIGYRKYGLKLDDIWIETPDMEKAVERLPEEQQVARLFRFQRAIDASMHNDFLPEPMWTKPSEDTPYLQETLEEVRTEEKEKALLK